MQRNLKKSQLEVVDSYHQTALTALTMWAARKMLPTEKRISIIIYKLIETGSLHVDRRGPKWPDHKLKMATLQKKQQQQ